MTDKILFLQPAIRRLDEGDLLRSITFFVLNIAGGAMLSLGIYQFYQSVRDGSFGEIVTGIVQLAALVVATEILLIRARNIHTVGKSNFTALPIAAVVVTIGGEVLATLVAGTGISACLSIWIEGGTGGVAGGMLLQLLMSIGSAGSPFLSGLFMLIGSLVIAYLLLLLFSLLAESTIVLVSIWQQLRTMNEKK